MGTIVAPGQCTLSVLAVVLTEGSIVVHGGPPRLVVIEKVYLNGAFFFRGFCYFLPLLNTRALQVILRNVSLVMRI